jgi:transposase-like protein
MRRKIKDDRDARACLRAVRAAGISAGEWAREHGVDGRSLNAWRINLSRSGAPEEVEAKPRLVELVPAAPSRAAARYVVHVDDARIELADDFREETLLRLVRALRAC